MTQQTVRDPGSGILDMDAQAYEYHLVAEICLYTVSQLILLANLSSICMRKSVVPMILRAM